MSQALYPASRHDRPHARIYDHDLQHPAWKGLSANAFRLITMLMASYRPNNPNSFPVGGATIERLIGVSAKTAKRIVDELIEAGHLQEERKGCNRGNVKTRERVVSLTRYDTETCAGNPNKPIEVWCKSQTPEKVPTAYGKKAGFEKSASLKKPKHDGENIIPLKTPATRI